MWQDENAASSLLKQKGLIHVSYLLSRSPGGSTKMSAAVPVLIVSVFLLSVFQPLRVGRHE